MISAQSRKQSQARNKRIEHCEYVYFTDLPIDCTKDQIDDLIEAFENEISTTDESRGALWDIVTVIDYVTEHITLRFACRQFDLEEEYEF